MQDSPRLAAVLPRSATRPASRNDAVDFWRGFILCTIFVNHVPGNVFENFTYRNIGVSDSAEAFVFISGVALALAYGHRFAQGWDGAAILSLGKRAVRLYGLHIALSLTAIAIFATGATLFANAGLMDVHGRDLVVDDPLAAFIGLISLGHQFGYFNILPLYVLLVAAVPILLWLARFGQGVMLGVSLAVYVGARVLAINIPTWPMRGEWFLDPFTWQFLMAIGLAVGLRLGQPVVRNRVCLTAASLVAAAALVGVTDGFGFCPGLYDSLRAWADLDKTMLGAGRILHFLALAYLVSALGLAQLMRRTLLFRPLALIGRNGLAVFVTLSVLAAIGQVVTAGLGHSLVVDTIVIAAGLALLYGAALLFENPARLHALPLAGALNRR